MAYIGAKPVNGFFAKQDLTADGSTTTFTLDFTVSSTSSILVSVGGVIQEPGVAYTLSGGNTSIVFSTAPASTLDVYIQYLGQAIVQNITDLNGTELIIDVDADTTMTADTDDEIDFKIGGSDVITFKATGIHLPDGEKYFSGTGDDLQLYHDGSNSYLANSTGALKLATETSGIAVTIGHSTSEVTIGDNLTVTGDLTIGGTTNFGDFNITNVGSIALDTITNDGTDITLDSSGDIILDAAGNDVFFKAGGTTIGEIENESNNLIIKSSVSDADLILRGNDGGSEISALTFDMSAAGKATFNDQVVIGDGKLVLNATAITTTAAEINLIDGGTSRGTTAVASGDGILTNDGGTMRMTNVDTFDTYFSATTKTLTNKTLTTPVIATVSSSSNDFTVDAGADIILDADGADIKFKDGGTDILSITNNSTDVDITVATQDKDIRFKGDDGGSGITALTLDMSDAGTAVFNHDIRIADDGQIGSASDADAMTINSSGVVTFSQNPVATLATAAQGNITSLGTLTALTVDDVAVNGKVITTEPYRMSGDEKSIRLELTRKGEKFKQPPAEPTKEVKQEVRKLTEVDWLNILNHYKMLLDGFKGADWNQDAVREQVASTMIKKTKEFFEKNYPNLIEVKKRPIFDKDDFSIEKMNLLEDFNSYSLENNKNIYTIYSKDIKLIIEAHANTYRVAKKIY